jgi:hypothetical protein
MAMLVAFARHAAGSAYQCCWAVMNPKIRQKLTFSEENNLRM